MRVVGGRGQGRLTAEREGLRFSGPHPRRSGVTPQGCRPAPDPQHSRVGPDPITKTGHLLRVSARMCACVRACTCVAPHPPPSMLGCKKSPPIVHLGKALGVNQCKLGGEIFLSCRVGIFYRLKVDQFFNTFKRENYLCIHMKYIYIYICIIYKDWHPASLCPGPALVTRHHSAVLSL